MTSQEQNGQTDREEGVVKLLTAGIEGYFFKLEQAMMQKIFQDMDPMTQMMVMQGNQKKTEKVDDARKTQEKLLNIFTKLASENLELKLENAILKEKSKEAEKATLNQ